MMRHWQDKGARRVWRWILLMYSLAALVLSVIGALTFLTDIILAAIFATSAAFLAFTPQFKKGVVWLVIILLLLPTLPYGLVYGCFFFELPSSRYRDEQRIFGVPLIRVEDGVLTPYYRQLVSEDLPGAKWLPMYKGQIGLLGVSSPLVHYMIGSPDYSIKYMFLRYNPPEEVREAIAESYFTLGNWSEEPVQEAREYLASQYASALEQVFMRQDGDVSIAQLPDPNEIIEKWRKKREERR